MPQPEQTDYTSLLRLDGRNAAVLGAGNGIGIESAHALAQAGAKVYCFDHHEDRAQEIASDVGGVGVSGDVTSREDLERLFTKMRDEDGGVDCLVDIVGRNTLGPLGALDDDDWADQLRMVVDHGFRAMQIGAREMAASGGGSMIFVGSIAGLTHMPSQTAYGSAKAALHHMVACLSKELAADGVRINVVAPGLTSTPKLVSKYEVKGFENLEAAIPMGRLATPGEIASIILFLASDMSSYITGQSLVADGGLSGNVRLGLTQ